MLQLLVAIAICAQDDVKPNRIPQIVPIVPAPYNSPQVLPAYDYQALPAPIVISAIRSYAPVTLLVRDEYRCRDIEIGTNIPTDKLACTGVPGGVLISTFRGLFATRTTFDFGGYKKVVSIHKNGKVVID